MKMIKKPFISSLAKTTLAASALTPSHSAIIRGNYPFDAIQAMGYYVSEIVEQNQILPSSVIRLDGSKLAIADVRELKNITASKSDRPIDRILCIENFENLNNESQNTMLKMIEEPAAGIVYVLSTSNIGAILSTIVSRSAVLRVSPPSQNDYSKHFKDTPSPEIEKALQIARGDTQKALDYLEAETEALKTAKQVLSSDKFARLTISNMLSKERGMATEVVTYIQNILLFMLEQSIENSQDSEAQSKLTFSLSVVEKTLSSLKANGNVKLALDHLFVAI